MTNLREDVVHLFAGLRVAATEEAEETEDLDLKEGVGDAGDVVFWRVAGRDEGFEVLDEQRNRLFRRRRNVRSSATRPGVEGEAAKGDAHV